MKVSNRFDSAIKKLYTAFNNKCLNPEDCKQCAVGNILDNTDAWQHLTDFHGSERLNYVGRVHQNIGRRFNGYTPLELLQIETAFLKGCGYSFSKNKRLLKPDDVIDESSLYRGFMKVITQLCKLEGIKDILRDELILKYLEGHKLEKTVDY